jgi:hypothetical protein
LSGWHDCDLPDSDLSPWSDKAERHQHPGEFSYSEAC